MVKVLLNRNEFPITIEVPLINTLNTKNPKLNVSTVEYIDLKDEYNVSQKRSGVIVDESPLEKKILAYIFLSTDSVGARNSFVAQSIFPDLIDLMELCIKSPSFTVLNHPVFFINTLKYCSIIKIK
jgi:hypothetical protein